MTMDETERRLARRHQAGEHRIVSARVRPGQSVALVDVSTGGALIETSRRLLPGAFVELQLDTERRRATLRSAVLRCAIVRLTASTVCYRAAVAFDRPLPWFADEGPTVYSLPTAETRPGRASRVDPTQGVM